jgi:toxin-antitoxin system PIN domain toxin
MIAVDTNILVYAHREDSPLHEGADRRITELAESGRPWAIPWPCIHEFLAISTHPRIYQPPTPLEDAVQQVECWLESPTLVLLGEMGDYWRELRRIALAARITGPRVHDARIAAICLQHGVRLLWSADRDLSRFPDLTIENPLVT